MTEEEQAHDKLMIALEKIARLANDNAQLMSLLGQIATAQPTHPRSYDAEQLLCAIGHPEYTRKCSWCQTPPAWPQRCGAMLCLDCDALPMEGQDHAE